MVRLTAATALQQCVNVSPDADNASQHHLRLTGGPLRSERLPPFLGPSCGRASSTNRPSRHDRDKEQISRVLEYDHWQVDGRGTPNTLHLRTFHLICKQIAPSVSLIASAFPQLCMSELAETPSSL